MVAKIYSLAAFFFFFVLVPLPVSAATLSFSESVRSYAVGNTFTLSVYVESSDQAMNAASGVVSFPWSTLEVVSLSKVGSIFSLWPEEPTFSNSAGTANFEGIVLNPGFKGAKGKILTITFRAKAIGTANVSFSSGSVLANDGTGTNILEGSRVAVITIGEMPAPAPPYESVPVEGAPTIISTTHPDQLQWYSSGSPTFSWVPPEGALEVRTLIDRSPQSVPTVQYAPPIASKTVSDLPDGTHYFHLQIRTESGWSSVAHYRVNIDTTPPKAFSITFPHGARGFEPQPVILFNTTDSGSGVSYYDVKIGSGGPNRATPIAISNPYPLPLQDPGDHVVTVTAYDKAGNAASATADFTIVGIEAPVITDYPKEVEEGDLIHIRGTTYDHADVTIVVRQDGQIVAEEKTRSNGTGDFGLIITKRLDPGVYTFTARVTDARGARSDETMPKTIVVKSKSFEDFMASLLSHPLLVTLAILALVGSIAGLVMGRRFSGRASRLRREGVEAEKILEKSFNLLRRDLQEHITRLKAAKSKRGLTSEEVAFLERFEEELSEAKDIITKEVQDVSHS